MNASSKQHLTCKKLKTNHAMHYGRSSLSSYDHPQLEQVINNISARRFPLESFLYKETLFQIMSFEHGINPKIMQAIINLFLAALTQYSKIIVVRVDLRVYTETPDNSLISKFRKTLLRYLAKKYQSTAWFLWVREQTPRSDKAHYHCVVILNGHKVLSSWGPYQLVVKACYMHPDIASWIPKSASYKVERKRLKGLDNVIHRASYMAKNYSKELTPQNVKRFHASSS